MFSRFQIGMQRTIMGLSARRSCYRLSNRQFRWNEMVENLLQRTDEFNTNFARLGFGSSETQMKSFALFNDWRQILFKIPHDESKILYQSASSIDKLLHINLDEVLKNTCITNEDFRPSPSFLDDLTTGIYAWGRTATKDTNSPVRAEVLFNKFLKISENSTNQKPIYHPTSEMYSALVYCWSQASSNDIASKKCLGWFRKIHANQSMTVDPATWNAVLRIHVRQRIFLGIERDLLSQYSVLNDGYTFVSLVEGWMNAGLPDGPKNAYKELQSGITFCIDKKDQIPALNQLIFLYLTQSITKGRVFESERVMNQAIDIQESRTELEILDVKHFIVVMNALTVEGDFQKVYELFQKLKTLYERGFQRLQPNYQVLVVVLTAIVRKQDRRSLEAGEQLLSMVEACMVEKQSSESVITNHAFNVMLDSYVRSPRVNNRRERVENLIERMKHLSIEYNNPSLHPDKVSYAAFMRAVMKEGKPGFSSEIENILDRMEHSSEISIQPDKKVYAIVLESYFISNDDALFRAKALVERMKKNTKLQPDRVMYTILMKIHSLHNDVHGSDEVLHKMIQADNSSRLYSPNEEAFVTAMTTWGQSRRKDKIDGALRIYNNMATLYARGNLDCRPSIKSFGKLMVILAKSEQKSKLQTGRRLFSEMEKYGVKPDISLFNWFIRVCSTTKSRRQSDEEESWTEALATFNMLEGNRLANSHTYNSIFHAGDSLLQNQDDRYSVFRDVFSKCKHDGQVDMRILISLKRFLPSNLYRELTTLNPRDDRIHIRNIPPSWKRKTHQHIK